MPFYSGRLSAQLSLICPYVYFSQSTSVNELIIRSKKSGRLARTIFFQVFSSAEIHPAVSENGSYVPQEPKGYPKAW